MTSFLPKRPILFYIFTFIALLIYISNVIAIKMIFNIVFPSDYDSHRFCNNIQMEGETNTEDILVKDSVGCLVCGFVLSAILFLLSPVFLVLGIAVAYAAPEAHGCLKVLEDNHPDSETEIMQGLFIFNLIFTIGFAALTIEHSLLYLFSKSTCTITILFWYYEIQSWGVVALYGLTAAMRNKKATMSLNDGKLGGHISEDDPVEMAPDLEIPIKDMERRINKVNSYFIIDIHQWASILANSYIVYLFYFLGFVFINIVICQLVDMVLQAY